MSAAQLVEALRSRKYSLGLAESCTGGLLSSVLTAIPGVSDLYKGAIVSYSNSVKEEILGVNPATLKKFGAVSAECAAEMAKGARRVLKVDCAIAITGIAGPNGGSMDKPVGTVFLAIQGPDFEYSKKEIFAGSRTEIQSKSVDCSIEYLLNQILNAHS